ncbi:protein polybromo-1-like [Trifolium medium]|uniref:Protein polybromo-1-like n=1 Tax=Trifolium medium TaxID=97028 RepID=A0A392N1E6_9FABA|nr:protein polybromo-1-like [Trifolium medium]
MSSYAIQGSQEIIEVGDKVLLKPSKSKEPPYVGFVKKITSGTRKSDDTKVTLRWFYRPHEIAIHNKTFIGEKELFYSSQEVVQSAKTIMGKCLIYTFKDFLKLKVINRLDFYCRYKYDPDTKTISVPGDPATNIVAV